MDESIDCSAVRDLIPKKNVVPRQIVQDNADKKEKKPTLLSPSEYVKCITTNPEAIVLENYEKRESTLFTADPKIIVFKNFEPGEIYCVTFTIQNTSPIPHYLQLVHLDNVSFNVTFRGSSLNTRLAAGMTHVYEVQFHPDEKRDYRYNIEFETEIESFVIPVLAVGPRALLSFPDEVDMGRTAVKVAQTESILLQNFGDIPTGFSIYTDNSCFTVNPSKGYLKVRETKHLLIKFLPTNSGCSSARVFIRYEEGDKVQSLVYGEAIECDVKVIEENLTMEDTYFGLSRITFIEIQNNSEFLLDYEWVKYPSVEEDLKEKEKKLLEISSDLVSDSESISSEAQELIKQRILSDNTEMMMQESLPFDNAHFSIYPLKLQVQPRSSTKVTLTFQPTKVGDIESFAYLEIGGLQNRICVNLSGKCLGPALRLNVLSLDIQQVYLCSAYHYKIVCENFGPIPGTLTHVQKNTDFGSTIRLEPNEIKVNIGELKTMDLCFCSDRTGEFVERVDFVIDESSDVLSFVLKGCVICPLKKICANKLNFDSASVGFTMKEKLWIKNLSFASMHFNLKIPSDGYEIALSYLDFSRALTKPTLPKCPREFYVDPSEGIIEPKSRLCVEVCYTPNVARSGDAQLLVNACKSPYARPLVIPMSFNAKSAAFEVTPAKIYIRFCFINFPYRRTLTIANTSDAHGYFYFVPQEVSDDDEVLYSLSTYQGHLEPGHRAEIALTVIVQEIGEHKVDLNLFGIGFETPIKCCEITCHGKGPVVSVEPSQLNWGQIEVLQKQSLDLKLTNDSPISAKFTATVNKHKSIWDIEPSSGELNPNESITLKVHAFLRDTGKFTDRLSITIFNGQTINVGLSAIGVGCCIVFEPHIFPEFNMGYQFSRQDICIPIIVKNEGTKSHHLLLTNVEKPRQAKKAPAEENKSLFKIEPNIIEALPASIHTIYCKIRWNANETVEEQWYLHATIEGQAKRELLGSSMFTATFMEPDISFDKSELTFRLDFGHDRENIQQQDEIVVTNRSGRDLSAHVTIDSPFRIVEECNCGTDYVETTLRNNKPFALRVYFPYSNSCTEPLPKIFEGYLKIEYNEHKQIDKIPCKAEVNYPHLIFIPEEVTLYCPTGKIIEERVKFVNNTPLPVIYKIEWLRDMFSCRSLPSMAESKSGEGSSEADKSVLSVSSSEKSELDTVCKKSSSFEDMYEGAEEILSVSEQPSVDLIDKFLQISPQEGHIIPHSEGYVTFTFNGFQKTQISAQSVCHIERGSTTILNVHAIADDVKCEIQNEVLDFGLGLFCEPSFTTLIVCNQCMIPLVWTIDSSSECLIVIDGPSVIAPDAENIIRIERSPTAPGIFSEKMILDVAYLQPFVIDVKWLSTIPQVYFDAARDREFEKYPADFGYEAVRMVIAECAKQDDKFVETMCLSSSSEYEECTEEEEEEDQKKLNDYELTQLIDDGWQIISENENYPSRIDIDMAFERHLVKNYLEATSSGISTPAYTIDVGYVIVEQTSQLSVPLKNYGYEKAKVTLKINTKVRKPTETCFYVELEKNTEICQCESTFLNVTFRPKKKIFTQKRTDASYKFQLEVRHGLTIPVTVKAAAVYPHLTVNVENLDFEKIFVGECRRMSFVMRNDGFVDCHWLMSLTNAPDAPKKCEQDPFYVGRANDKFAPGQEETLYVYFRPLQNGIQKFNLTITVLNGYEAKTISLTGCGVERRISIDRATIKCTPVIPNVDVTEKYFTVKNPNSHPIEIYWDHLTDFSQSNRIVRLLKHYYDTYEILIPQRKFGESMPSIFQDFYNELIHQMCTDQEFQPIVEEWLGLCNGSMNGSEKNGTEKKDNLKRKKSKQLVEKNESDKLIAAVAMANPEEVEFLLAEYISKLKERPNYMEGNDPLSQLYRMSDEETQANLITNDPQEHAKNLIVIFYGPSFSEPQETACRVAKTLNLPLLNLNQIFLEALALSQTESAQKLADQLDTRYKELTVKFEKLKAVLLKKNTNNAIELLKLSQKIPSNEVLDSMDAYDRCELKLEIITSIMNFMESDEIFGASSVKDKASVKSQDVAGKRQSVVLPVARDTYHNVLRERLSLSKFDDGYVLQTLNNDFLRNEVTTMKMLLEATGNVKIRFLITFYKQPGSYDYEDCESNESCNKSSEVSSKVLTDYQNGLAKLLETISNWENGYSDSNKSVKGKRKSELSSHSFTNPPELFSVWHINVSKNKQIYDPMILQLKSIASLLEDKNESPLYVSECKTFSILREYKNETQPADNFSLLASDANNEEQFLKAQWIIPSRKSQQFKVNFQASKSGLYASEFFLTLLDNPAATFKISVEGVADIPRLDFTPIAMFNAVKDTKLNDTHEPCYFLDTEVYDFGCLLVLSDNNRLHKRSTQFKLKNISAVPANVSFSLTSENYDCFDICPRKTEIRPSETVEIEMTACSLSIGTNNDTLIAIIENNDQSVQINLESTGVEMQVEIEPQHLNLGRILCGRLEKHTLTLRNRSAIAIYWHLTCDSKISFPTPYGKIRARGNCEIELQYFASKVGTDTTFFNVAWCLVEDNNDPIAIDNVDVTAETYIISYEIALENSIDLGNVPVGTTANKSFAVKNLGPYEFEFRISRSEELLSKRGIEFDFQCYPLAGLVLPKKQIDITVSYNPTVEFKVQSNRLFNLDIIEPYKNVGMVGNFNINISAISFFTKFVIEPYPNINFGTLALNSTKSMQFKIKNIGKFPLIYTISTQPSPNQLQSETFRRDSMSKKTKKSVQSEKVTAKRRMSGMANFRLKCGPFTLDKFKGELDVGDSEDISVQCSSDMIGDFEETLSVTVQNSKDTREINLFANVRIAEIAFQDYDEIFAGSYVVATSKELELLSEPDPHTVFSIAEQCLHFRRVCVGTQHIATVTLKNVSLIDGDVSIGNLDDPFKVDANKLNIPATSKQTFSIIFAPDHIDNFTSSLKITLDLPSTLEPQSLTIDMMGEGHVPQISIIDPMADDCGIFTLNFGLSYICEWREKSIHIKNVGEISANVIVEIAGDPNGNCNIQDENDSRLICGCVDEENGCHLDTRQSTFKIEPCEIQRIKIKFFPVKCGKYDNCLRIFVEQNPYEVFEVNVKGEGFCKPIVLENLELIDALPIQNSRRLSKQKSQKRLSLTHSSSKILNPAPLTYKLDYGKCFLNKAYKINFKITNKTTDRYYRFQWTSCRNVTCSPVAGHVMPDGFKEITATFNAYKPTSLSHLPLDCTTQEIILTQPLISCSWDTRQTQVLWMENSRSLNECDAFDDQEFYFKKLVKESQEPEYIVVPDTLQMMQLLVSGVADYSDYHCDVNCINFDDTLMFQTRECQIKLENTSSVNLNYTWELTMDESYPIRLDQSTLQSTDNNESKPTTPPNSPTRLKKTVKICSPGSQQLSDLFSNSAGMTNRSTDSWIEGENLPFEIIPEAGSVAPKNVIEYTLKFKPLDVFQYKACLWCRMENLNPMREPLNIVVTAKSLLPYCHFEIEPSDYLDKRDIHLPVPIGYSIADKTRVVEFRMIGVEECHARYLYLINPTTEDYSFQWSRLSIGNDENPFVMQCLQETGLAEKGKRTRIMFAIMPKHIGTFETFWTFEIDKHDLTTLFLIVANVCEPNVNCKNALLKLPTATIGETRTATFEITNNECCCIKFWLDDNSMFSDGRLQKVYVCPMTGILEPNTCQAFSVEYEASLIGEHNFKVLCYVEKLKKPMKVSIIAQVKDVLSTVFYTNYEGLEIKLDESSDNKIDLKGLLLNTSTKLPFKIINSGEISFDYQWKLSTCDQDKLKICVSQSEATVQPNTHEICYLDVTAMQKVNICNYIVKLEVKSGPIYRIKLNSETQKPALEFSFKHYDFGACYILERGTSKLNTVDLLITNNQKIPCVVKCNNADSANLSLNLEEIARAIPPNDSARVVINFTPHSESLCEETLNFSSTLADGTVQNNIRIQGEGVSYKIRLKNPCDALLDFGNVKLGKSMSRKIVIINAGCLAVQLKPIVRGISDAMRFVKISPNALKVLKSNREFTVTITLRAIYRVKSLKAEIGFEMDGTESVLLTTLKANCIGADIRLNRECISFGMVYEGCVAEEKLILVNDGDVGSRFSWNIDKTKLGFSISPLSGFSSPGSEITFVCCYEPSCCSQTEAVLELEELENLSINLSASTCRLPEPKEVVNFKAEIQQSQTQEIRVLNDSNQRWHLKPKISGDCFTSTATLNVDSKTSEIYTVTYNPKKLTAQETVDEGKLIIPFPDGRQPLVYSLQGRCTPATISQKIIRTVPCKRKHIENLVVYNNTDRARDFDSLVELDNKTVDYGIPRIRVPANSSKRCKLPLYFENQGNFHYKVTFHDDQDNYQYFDIDYTVTSPEINSTIDLVTFVRASTFTSLKIGNPSKDEVSTFDGVCSNQDVILHGLPTALKPLAYKNVRIEYFPLIPCDVTATLEITSSLLGSVFYELRLKAKPVLPEKATCVKACLGNCANFSLLIKNYSKNPTEFAIEADEPSITCENTIKIPANDESILKVNFEPHSLETVNAIIKATSNTAGEFIFPIVGRCTPPQPQGPFLVSAEAPASINFKNIFLQSSTFQLSVDNPMFTVDNSQLTINSKESANIIVKLEDCKRTIETGKLLVISASNVKWTYYLRAECQ